MEHLEPWFELLIVNVRKLWLQGFQEGCLISSDTSLRTVVFGDSTKDGFGVVPSHQSYTHPSRWM